MKAEAAKIVGDVHRGHFRCFAKIGSFALIMSAASTAANLAQQVPGWLGTLAISFDGGIVYSAGELSGDTELAPKFLELVRHVAEYMTLEGPSDSQENPFKRLTNYLENVCMGDVQPFSPQSEPERSTPGKAVMVAKARGALSEAVGIEPTADKPPS
ncbi:Ragulator complex protein LAMTOR4 [Taenia solium]|eukprot:TsM_000618800 transcript=TsM_000618800 gene=TsM_000618800